MTYPEGVLEVLRSRPTVAAAVAAAAAGAAGRG